MFELNGKYTKATIFAETVDNEAISQILGICNEEFAKESKIVIMPDVHAGKGCTIGTTMTVADKVVPNLVGVDIGCGVYCVKLKEKEIDFELLDKTIRSYVPSGMEIREKEHRFSSNVEFDKLKCKNSVNVAKAKKSLGSLGGGNHFIEVAKDEEGYLYLVIHSGSRGLGVQVASWYQKLAIKTLSSNNSEKDEIITRLKAEGREKEIQEVLKNIPKKKINKELAYLEGENYLDYLNDLDVVQKYSTENRKAIAETIISKMNLTEIDSFTTIHNYIDLSKNILRKGAISALKDEKVIIPINMRDGSIIAVGKGNPDWNYSAPHGAGRVFSRGKAKELLSMDDFKETMSEVWSTSVCESTLDESPMAYKDINEILGNIKDTVEVVGIIKPIYNFKAN